MKYFCFFLLFASIIIRSEGQTKANKVTTFYSVHQGVGEFGSITLHYRYWFENWTIHAEPIKMTIGYYKNVQFTKDPAFQQALQKEGISLPITLNAGGFIGDFTGTLQRSGCSLVENRDFKIANVSSANWTSIEPSQNIKDCAEKYRRENANGNFFHDKGRILAGASFSNIRFSEFQNKVLRAEKNMLAAKNQATNNSKQFDSQLQRAQLLANEGNIAGAEEALRQARSMAGNDQALVGKLRSAEGLVANRKTQQQQQAKQQVAQTTQAAQQKSAPVSQYSGQQSGQSSSGQASSSNSQGSNQTARTQNPQPSRETQQQMARVYQQIEQNKRNAEDIRVATEETTREWQRGNYIQGSSAQANAYARQGNAGAAYATMATGIALQGASMIAEARARKEAAREANAAREAEMERERAIRERERAEKARIEKQRVDFILSTRANMLEEYGNSKPIPLSTSKETANRIYYFLYDANAADRQREQTTIYVSNVFEIGRFNDGTWPYQSAVNNDIKNLTPYGNLVMHGYYTSKEDAEQMRQLFVDQMKQYGGATINEVAYKGKPAAASMAAMTGTADSSQPVAGNSSLGIPIGQGKGTKQKEQPKQKAAEGSLGVPIPAKNTPAKSNESSLGVPIPAKKNTPAKSEESSLGIPIKMKK